MPRLLPHLHVENFLSDDLSGEFFSYAVASREKYTAARVGSKEDGKVDERTRVSLIMRDLGHFDSVLQERLHNFYPAILAGLKMADFKVRADIELELAAHGDGAFFKPHIDMRPGPTGDRVLSAVYYMHSMPRVFSGGGLKIFPVQTMPGNDLPIEIAPKHNSLLVFPSYVLHEVLPVVCPGAAFADYRFAVNCWMYQARP